MRTAVRIHAVLSGVIVGIGYRNLFIQSVSQPIAAMFVVAFGLWFMTYGYILFRETDSTII